LFKAAGVTYLHRLIAEMRGVGMELIPVKNGCLK
jgi:hypothetical protein